MNKKLKLAIAALLGFSAACSTVKNAPKEQQADTTCQEEMRHIRVMYGVPRPENRPPAARVENKDNVDPSNPPVDSLVAKSPARQTDAEMKPLTPSDKQ